MIKRILFVDVQNSTNSPMAEAWFNRHAGGCAKASSCGLAPAEWVDAQAIQAMYQLGIEIGHQVPKRLDLHQLNHMDLVIWMGADLPVSELVESRVWRMKEQPGSCFEEVCARRDDVRRRVDLLVKEIQRLNLEDLFSDKQWKTAVANLQAM